MNATVIKLLRECRKKSGYAHGHKWEPGMDFNEQENTNHPFKPHSTPRADKWGGDLGSWQDALVHGRVGHSFDFYITSLGPSGELETNFYVDIINEREAHCQDCGGKPFQVVI
jgi:hypothetical protein